MPHTNPCTASRASNLACVSTNGRATTPPRHEQATLAEQQKKLGATTAFTLAFVRTRFGVVEDRAANVAARLNAFAGRKVVKRVNYADVGGSNRLGNVALGGGENDPLLTTVTTFTGPIAQKATSRSVVRVARVLSRVLSPTHTPLGRSRWSGRAGWRTLRSNGPTRRHGWCSFV